MSKQKLTVVATEARSGNSKKNGSPWSMTVCQCILTDPEGKQQVGEVILPKDHAEVTPGDYIAETQLGRTFDGKIIGTIVRLQKFGAVAAPKAA